MPTRAGLGRPARLLILAVVIAGAVAVLGGVALWPRGEAPDLGTQPSSYVDARVTGVDTDSCVDPGGEVAGGCRVVSAELTSGADAGDTVEFQVRGTQVEVPELAAGDRVVLLDVATAPPQYRYAFHDFQRRTPLLWLVALLVAVVVAIGRWQGVRALAGLAATGAVLVAFLVPALLRDEPAVQVALAAAAAIGFLALYLTHGFSTGTTVAVAGMLAGLALTTGLAVLAVTGANLTGLAGGHAQTLRLAADALDLRGLLVAGIVVGALGVLHDVTVSQVSIVATLRRANPGLSRTFLYREATRLGRDHVAATVNTLVLAYAGASLPLLLLLTQGDQPVGRLLTGEVVAIEVVRMLVGSIGLVASVPITTALAAAVLGPERVPAPAEAGWGPGIQPPEREEDAVHVTLPDDDAPAHAARSRRRRRTPAAVLPGWDDVTPSRTAT
ncbi:MAG TPA: YibE/F family protein [Acidimicrobiales bacterium]